MRILIVDDEPVMQDVLGTLLRREGFQVTQAMTAADALKQVDDHEFDLVLLDLMLPDRPGLEVLKELKGRDPEVVVVVITAFSSVETAIVAMREGAFHYIPKPFKNQEVVLTVRKGLEQRRLRTENRALRQRLAGLENLIWRSPAMERVVELVRRAAPSRSNILLTGESGTGKEVVARIVHQLSTRSEGPFVVVNTSSVPADLLESTLFGHVRGAFTGAVATRRGLFEVADGGTIFLDEIGTISLPTQAKLLRVIQEREFIPVGAEQTLKVDVRIIAATNADLTDMVRAGTFREDLYYRLNVIPFYVPPLRERIEDVPLLADYFLKEFTTAYGRRPKEFTADAYDLLTSYHWPGNVRELRNLVERIVIMNPQSRIEARHIPLVPGRRPAEWRLERFASLQEVREAAEREYILKKLEETGGNVTRAAELLGLERSNLYRKMRALGIKE